MIEGTVVTFSLWRWHGLLPVFFGCPCFLQVRAYIDKPSMKPTDGWRYGKYTNTLEALLLTVKNKTIRNTKGWCYTWGFTISRTYLHFWKLNSLWENLNNDMLFWLGYSKVCLLHSSNSFSLKIHTLRIILLLGVECRYGCPLQASIFWISWTSWGRRF